MERVVLFEPASPTRVATIDLRAYDETYNIPMNQLDIHQSWRSYSHRARIDAAAGGHANHALWRFGPAGVPPSIAVESFLAMDAWLTGLVASSPKEWTNAQRTQQQVAAILKCQLKPLAASDYAPITFLPSQWSRLQTAFAQGVCDWSKPGVGQADTAAPMTFRAGAGGQPLGARPASS
jgi:hypothetical protein